MHGREHTLTYMDLRRRQYELEEKIKIDVDLSSQVALRIVRSMLEENPKDERLDIFSEYQQSYMISKAELDQVNKRIEKLQEDFRKRLKASLPVLDD